MQIERLDNQTTGQPDYLPISMLNQLEYCERRFYLMHVLGEMEVNAHVLEGVFRHEKAHSQGIEREGEKATHRRVYVWSDALGIAGYADLVEEMTQPDPLAAPEGLGRARKPVALFPVEYKKGRAGRWLSDHVQLCAQAMCLEERLGTAVEKGFIFYFGSRRREEVFFTPELRQRAALAVERARELSAGSRIPPPVTQAAKCRDCSLQPVCLPEESIKLSTVTGVR
jgi:CRISPR-associated exonuclease Cas4